MSAAFQVPPQVHARQFDGETIVLNLAEGKYFSLDQVGSVIWSALTGGKSSDDVVAQLVETYDVDEETARADVQRLTAELVGAGLLAPAS